MNIMARLKGMMTLGVSTIVTMLISFITVPVLTHLVDTEDFGMLSVFNIYTHIAVMVLCLGLDQSLLRYYYDDERLEYKKGLFGYVVKTSVSVSILAVAFVLLLQYFRVVDLGFPKTLNYILAVNVIVHVINRFVMLEYRAEYKMKWYSALNIMQKAGYLLLGLCFVPAFGNNADKSSLLILAYFFSMLIPTGIGLLQVKHSFKAADREIAVNFNRREILRYSLPFIISLGITTIFESLDKLFIRHFCGYAETGIYSSALYIVSAFAIVQTTFSTVWAPLSMEHYHEHPDDKKFYSMATRIITVIAFGLGICLLVSKDLFALILGEQYRDAAYIMPFLIFHPVMYMISETTMLGIEFQKKSRLHVVVGCISCAANFIGNYVLVPVLGGKGAAISTGASYLVFFGLRTYFGQRNYHYDIKYWKLLVLTIAVMVNAVYSMFYPFGLVSVLLFLINLTLLLLLYRRDCIMIVQYAWKLISQKGG